MDKLPGVDWNDFASEPELEFPQERPMSDAQIKRIQRARIAQQIEAEENYPVGDPVWQAQFMLERLEYLQDRNAVDEIEAQDIFRDWYNLHNPEVIVKHLGGVAIQKPFYE